MLTEQRYRNGSKRTSEYIGIDRAKRYHSAS